MRVAVVARAAILRCSDQHRGLHLNISFQNGTYGKYFITHMNTLKFVLEFKEDQVYKYFPQREDLVYAKSIRYILPKNGLFYFDNAKTLVMFCNGMWCGQSPNNIKDLLKYGYPAEKIKWFRGGMQTWEILGFNTVK